MIKKVLLKIQAGKNHGFLVPKSSVKAQLKIQEMAFMLVAVMLFFILVGLFAAILMFSNLQDRATKIAKERAFSAVTNLADSPEFSCSLSKTTCVDADKLIILTNRSDIYQNFFPFSSLEIIRFHAFNYREEDMVRCSFVNYPDCDKFILYDKEVDNEVVIQSYIALCQKEYENGAVYDKCEIAKFLAGSEQKIIEKK